VKTVLVPKENDKDVEEISEEIKEGLEICFVETMEEVAKYALISGREEKEV
jgi:ATP-dependent Lon protease